MGGFSTIGGIARPPVFPPVLRISALELTGSMVIPAGVAYVVLGGEIIVKTGGELIVNGAIGV
ncbi:MAG: hypothetical protein QXM54_02865 [Desulfurococcaceae archaeon]